MVHLSFVCTSLRNLWLQGNLEKVEISTSSINCIVFPLRTFPALFLGLIHKRASLSDYNRQHSFENCHLSTCGFIDFCIAFTFEAWKSETNEYHAKWLIVKGIIFSKQFWRNVTILNRIQLGSNYCLNWAVGSIIPTVEFRTRCWCCN